MEKSGKRLTRVENPFVKAALEESRRGFATGEPTITLAEIIGARRSFRSDQKLSDVASVTKAATTATKR